jgi:GNAT superfamily N-acetyltransferase
MKTQRISIVNTRVEHVQALAEMQPLVFPNLDADELLRDDHYLNHLRLFPEGQFVAINEDGDPVAATSTFRLNFEFTRPQHSFLEVIDNGWFSNHESDGEWLYGADVSVHPDYRGLGIGRMLYDARTKLCERINLRGQMAGGLLQGYHKYANRMNAHAYCLKVTRGELSDPTLTMQLKMGYRYVGIIEDYYKSDDPAHAVAALIVKDNHRYIDN